LKKADSSPYDCGHRNLCAMTIITSRAKAVLQTRFSCGPKWCNRVGSESIVQTHIWNARIIRVKLFKKKEKNYLLDGTRTLGFNLDDECNEFEVDLSSVAITKSC